MFVVDKRNFSYSLLLDHRADETNFLLPPYLEHFTNVEFFEHGSFLHCLTPHNDDFTCIMPTLDKNITPPTNTPDKLH